MSIAKKHGVDFPEDVQVIFVDEKTAARYIPVGADATYGRFNKTERMSWDKFHNDSTGKIPVLVRKSVLESDEAIVGILGHEAYELRKLEHEFAHRESMSTIELGQKINARDHGRASGNLHEQAWDETNRLIEKMRRSGSDG